MLNYKEFVKLNDGYVYLSHTEIPDGIKSWVKNFSGSYVKDFKIDQSGDKVCIKMPWHERCVETYQFFNLTGNNAVPVGNSVTRKGYEGDSYQDFLENNRPESKIIDFLKIPEYIKNEKLDLKTYEQGLPLLN